MQLLAQSVDVGSVRRDTLNGEDYLVAPTILVKPSDDLHGGYVPSDELRDTVDDWNGRPLPLGHPTNPRGQLISANDPTVIDDTSVGEFYNAEYNPRDDSVRGEIWVNIDKAREMGGAAERALNKLANGEPLEVSSGYRSRPGDPGHYDGAFRDSVQVDIRPDHVALIPDGKGRCSWEEGCGAPRVNAEPGDRIDPDMDPEDGGPVTVVEDYDDASLSEDLTIHAQDDDATDTDTDDADADRQVRVNVRSSARRPTYSGTSESDWSKPTLDDYVSGLDLGDIDSVDDLSGDQKTQIAEMTLLGEASADSFDDLSFFPVVEPSSQNLNRNALNAVRGGRGSQADIPDDARESAQNMAGTLLEDEFDADVQGNDVGDDPDVDPTAAASAFTRFANALGLSVSSTTDDAQNDDQDPDDEPNANANADGDGDGDGDPDQDKSDAGCSCGGHGDNGGQTMAANQQEGDRVRWDSDSGTSREPDDVRYGIVINLLQDGPEDQVKVAVYAPDPDEGEWTPTGSDVDVSTDSLDVIEQFPPISQVSGNSASNQSDTDTDTPMSDYDLETLIANSAFSADELRDNDDLQQKVADTINITADGDGDGDGDGDANGDGDNGGDGQNQNQNQNQNQSQSDAGGQSQDQDQQNQNQSQSDGGDAAGGQVQANALNDLTSTVQQLQQQVEEQNETIAELRANKEAEKEEKRERLKNQIKANSNSYSDEQLDEAGDDLLESIAADVGGGFADLSARGTGTAQRANSQEDVDNMSAGTMADYKERQQAGGDD